MRLCVCSVYTSHVYYTKKYGRLEKVKGHVVYNNKHTLYIYNKTDGNKRVIFSSITSFVLWW